MSSIIHKQKQDTSTNLSSVVLETGEFGYATDTKEVKIGDGQSTFSNLPTVGENDIISLLNVIYPIGAIYLGTQNTCPMSVVMPGTTWTLVSSGRALWTGNGSNGNTTIAAGLPNITGSLPGISQGNTYGALYSNSNTGNLFDRDDSGGWGAQCTLHFDASRSSSVYGNSTTVQPPAYVVNAWRRTA